MGLLLATQNSKFLQFVSKMSRGELIVEDNQVKATTPDSMAGAWADEFQQQHPETWAAEFTAGEVDSCLLLEIGSFSVTS